MHLLIIVLVIVCIAIAVLFGLNYASSKSNNSSSVHSTVVRDRKVILAFGDSITKGKDIPFLQNYPHQLENLLVQKNYNYSVIEVAEVGATTAWAIKNIDKVLSSDPDMVLLEFGANDALQGLSPADARANLKIIIDKLLERKISIVLVGVEPFAFVPIPNKAEYMKIYPELSTEYGLPIVKSFLDGILLNPKLTNDDKMHPNVAGYTEAIIQNLWPVLEKELVK